MVNDDKLKKYVEEKIFKNYMIIGNITIDEFKDIDAYCKEYFNDNRKLMVTSLINYHKGDTTSRILDDKITLMYNNLLARIEKIESALGAVLKEDEPKTNEKPTWKGFKSQ